MCLNLRMFRYLYWKSKQENIYFCSVCLTNVLFFIHVDQCDSNSHLLSFQCFIGVFLGIICENLNSFVIFVMYKSIIK